MGYQLHVGLCEEVLKTFADNSIDAIVTDPPYGLSFMGNRWDYDVPTIEQWAQCLRVLKPGGHVMAFGGSRTYHRLVVNMEDAGFEIRDQILWIYGTGFPKSSNQSGDWEGWGTALKPAHEPIVMARKPFKGSIPKNLAIHGVGALNIQACRIPLDGDFKCKANGRPSLTGLDDNYDSSMANQPDTVGRWPANIIHDGSDVVVSAFPDAKGQQGAVADAQRSQGVVYGSTSDTGKDYQPRGDAGSAARFFYCAKVTPKERDEGMERFLAVSASDMTGGRKEGSAGLNDPRAGAGRTNGAKNNHPTIKPIALMKYLCRLITPPGGTVLDPWTGSGSTGRAAIEEGFSFVGIDRDPDFVVIASARLAFSHKQAGGAA